MMKDNRKKKVIIIGAGIAGMAAGVYLQAMGYDTEILEKNAVSGGACIGWERKGCYIDGCIHWLTGVNPRSNYYPLWRDIGALDDQTDIYFQDDFSVFDFGNGKRLTVWADVDRMREEMLAFAPEDEREIKRFCKIVKRFQSIEGPVDKPADMMSLPRLIQIGLTMAGDYYWVSKLSKISCEQYATRFKNPELQKLFSHYMSPGYNFMSFCYMMGHVTARNGGIPMGGSLPLVQRIEQRYINLGGNIRFSCPVERVVTKGDTVVGVRLNSGEVLHADWVVSSTPIEHCLKVLLDGKYKLKKIDDRLKDPKTYPVYTYSTVVLKCHEDVGSQPLSLRIYPSRPIKLDCEYDEITFRNYSYDKTMKTDDGSTVIQASMHGSDSMYYWWKGKKESGEYKDEKKKLANAVTELYESYYPFLKGKVEVIDVITPCTYERYLNSRHGCFQGFVETAKGKSLMQKGEIKGLKGFILAGQWLVRSGGMPPAVMTGKFAAQRIAKADKTKFVTPRVTCTFC